jgi:tetratricopeptide (TPR) repeat protein
MGDKDSDGGWRESLKALERLAADGEWQQHKELLTDSDVFVQMIQGRKLLDIFLHWQRLKHHRSLSEDEIGEALESMIANHEARGVTPQELADLRCEVSFLLTGLSCYSHAEKITKEALEILRQANCQNGLTASKAWLALANVNCQLKQVDDAKVQLKIASDLYEATDTHARRDLDSLLFSLSARLAFDQHKWPEVVDYASKAINAREKVFGPDARELLGDLHHLGIAYTCQGRGTEAESAFSRGVAIAENHFGPAHPDVATFQERLAWAYTSQNKFSPARELYEKVITTLTAHDGTDDLTWLASNRMLLSALITYAGLLMDYGEYAEAEKRVQQCLFRAKRIEGDLYSIALADAWSLMGELYFRQGRHKEADKRCSQAIELLESNTALPNVGLAQPLLTRGKVCLFRGDLPAAQANLQRGLEIVRLWFPTREREQIKFHAWLSEVHEAKEQHEEAAQHIARILEIEEKHGTFSPPILRSSEEIQSLHLRLRLCRHYIALGRRSEAEAIFDFIEERVTSALKSDTCDEDSRDDLLEHLLRLYEAFDRLSGVEACLRQILEIQEKALGKGHPYLAGFYGVLAEACASQHKYREAADLLRQAIDLRKGAADPSEPDPELIRYLTRANELSMAVQTATRTQILSTSQPALLPGAANEPGRMKVKPGWYYDLAQLILEEMHPRSIERCRDRFLKEDFRGSHIDIVAGSLCNDDPQLVLQVILGESGIWRIAEKLALGDAIGPRNASEVVLEYFGIRCLRPMNCIAGIDATDSQLKTSVVQTMAAPDKATLGTRFQEGCTGVESLLRYIIDAWVHLMFRGERSSKLTELLLKKPERWSFGDTVKVFSELPKLLDSSTEKEGIKHFFAHTNAYITHPKVGNVLGNPLEELVPWRNNIVHSKKAWLESSLGSLQSTLCKLLRQTRGALERMEEHYAVPRIGRALEETKDGFQRRRYTFLLDDQSRRSFLFNHKLDLQKDYVLFGIGVNYGAKDPLCLPLDELRPFPWSS